MKEKRGENERDEKTEIDELSCFVWLYIEFEIKMSYLYSIYNMKREREERERR